MRELNNKTLRKIHEGQVIKFRYQNGATEIGVVYEALKKDDCGVMIRCHAKNHANFIISKEAIDRGDVKFKILKLHSPVRKYGAFKEWDFVSNQS